MYTHLEDYIYNLYKSIGITNPADLDMSLIAKKLGVEVVYRRNTFSFDNEIVLVRGTSSQEWMDFGHEICHFLRHCGSQLNMHPLFIDLQEYQANYFSYHFCIPTFMLQRIHLPSDMQRAVPLIAETFNVEHNFAKKRLDKWLQQREVYLFNKEIARELSR